MLALSDLSGDDMTAGFREYLTAYPIEEERELAFARTWYAAEMARPGCVWTHTLLLPFDVVEQIAGLRQYCHLFVRPSRKHGFEQYRAPLGIEVRAAETESPLETHRAGFAAEVLAELYPENVQAEVPVLLAAPNAAEFEPFVLSLWAQLPAAFRCNFSFSTGSLGFRMWEEKSIDLQVVPRKRWKQIARASERAPAVFYDNADEPNPPTNRQPQWATTLADELFNPSAEFRVLLGTLSAMVQPRRSHLRTLVEVVLTLDGIVRGDDSAEHLVALLGTSFGRSEAPELKRALLGHAGLAGPSLPRAPEQPLLKALLQTDRYEAFSFSELGVASRVASTFLPHRGWSPSALEWLCGAALNPPAESLRRELLADMREDVLLEVFDVDPILAGKILYLAPRHLESSSIWNQRREIQRVCIAVARKLARRRDISAIVGAVVRAPGFGLGEELLQALGVVGVRAALTALNSVLLDGELEMIAAWTEAFRHSMPEVSKWASELTGPLAGRLLEMLSSERDLRVSPIRGVVAKSVIEGIRHEGGIRVASYADPAVASAALFVGLEEPSEDGAELASTVFSTVHAAAMERRLPWKSWRLLEPILPPSKAFSLFDWDHAEKLRRGLADRFVQQAAWPPRLLRAAAGDADTRERIVQYCEGLPNGRVILARASLV